MEKGSLTAREFEALVRDAVKSLPREFKRKLENINIVIEAEPSDRQKKEAGAGEDLLGLYEGVPLGQRSCRDGSVLPDKITIFRGPVLRSCLHRKKSKAGRAGPDNLNSSHRDQALACRSRREIRAAVRDTVLHEFAHYFGLSDEHMLEDGTY